MADDFRRDELEASTILASSIRPAGFNPQGIVMAFQAMSRNRPEQPIPAVPLTPLAIGGGAGQAQGGSRSLIRRRPALENSRR
jgi:hypothetical protein